MSRLQKKLLIRDHLMMLVPYFLLASLTLGRVSGWGVLKYPELINHLEKLEESSEDVEFGNRNGRNDDGNLKSLYKIIKEFGKRNNNLLFERKRMTKPASFMNKEFPTEWKSQQLINNEDAQFNSLHVDPN